MILIVFFMSMKFMLNEEYYLRKTIICMFYEDKVLATYGFIDFLFNFHIRPKIFFLNRVSYSAFYFLIQFVNKIIYPLILEKNQRQYPKYQPKPTWKMVPEQSKFSELEATRPNDSIRPCIKPESIIIHLELNIKFLQNHKNFKKA